MVFESKTVRRIINKALLEVLDSKIICLFFETELPKLGGDYFELSYVYN